VERWPAQRGHGGDGTKVIAQFLLSKPDVWSDRIIAMKIKLLMVSEEEQQTLREMGIFHPYPRSWMRAQGVLRLSQGLTLQQSADEFKVHLNSVEQWRHW
jgi:hypothetical protein